MQDAHAATLPASPDEPASATRKRDLPTALLLAAAFLVAADIRVVAPLLPAIADDFHVSIGDAGLTVAVYGFAYAGGQLLYGRLGDRVGRIRVIRSALLLFALATSASALASSLPVLLALRLVTGALAAGVIPMSIAYFGDTVPDYAARRRALGLFLSVIVTGQVMGQALGGILASVLSWRAIFLVLGGFAIVIAAAMHGFDAPRPASQRATSRTSFRQLLARDRSLYAVTFAETFFLLGAFAYAGASLIETHGASYPLVGALLGSFALGSLITSRTLTKVDVLEQDGSRVAVGGAIAAAGFVVLALTPPAPLFGAGVLIVGIGLTLAHSTLQARATEVSQGSRGAAVSLFAGTANVGGAFGTVVAGVVVDELGYGTLFGATVVGILLVAAAARRWLLPRDT